MGDVDALCERAASLVPDVELARDRFAAWLESRAISADIEDAALAEHWLVCALGEGRADAERFFESRYLASLERVLGRMRLSDAELDEVKQLVRAKLLVADATGKRKIEEYAGQGRLSGLISVVATREAIGLRRRTRRDDPLDDEKLGPGSAPFWDPGVEMLKGRAREAFRGAFEKAIRTLEPRQRNLLRLHLLGGVTLEQLATMYNVHRATIVRWLGAARAEVLERTKQAVADDLNVRGTELESLMQTIQSRLDVSVERVLASDAAGREEE